MEKGLEQKCKECQKPFVISENDKRHFLNNGLSLPKRCWECRDKRRKDNRIFDLSPFIGRYIARTKPSHTGDRSFLGDRNKIKLLGIKEDGSIVYEGKFFWEKNTEQTLSPDYNDGFWKVIEEERGAM